MLKSQAHIAVTDAFPKLLQLTANDKTDVLAVTPVSNRTTSLSTSIDLHLNRQQGGIYYWTFTLGTYNNSYLRDTPGVFNSRNDQEEI